MTHPLKMVFLGSTSRQGVCGVCGINAASVRMVWAYPRGTEADGPGEYQDQDLQALCREEAIQRQFLAISEKYLKGEHGNMPLLGAWRRPARPV